MKKKQMLLFTPLLFLSVSCSSQDISIPSNLVGPVGNEEVNDEGKFESQSLYDEIENSLAEDTIIDDYGETNPYLILRHALNKQAQVPYSLTIGTSTVNAEGIYKQEIESATYVTPEESFNQNISSSLFVETAFRFYDDYSGTIDAYEGKTTDDWNADNTPETYTYDQYIQAYGKLFNGSYYCTDGGEDIPDRFLTRDEEEFEDCQDETKREINALVIYEISAETISGSKIEKTDEGYEVNISMEGNEGTYYYQNQMLTTGGLSEKPEFSETLLTFQLSEDLYPISSEFQDSYNLKKKFLGIDFDMDATQTMTQYYFHSDTSTFTSGSKSVTVEVPELTDQDFNGFELFPEE